MNHFLKALRLVQLSTVNKTSAHCGIPNRTYAVAVTLGKTKKKKGLVTEKLVLPVEEDPHKLVKYVCGSNINKEGQDIEIKPDSEYPDWLWDIKLEPTKLEDLDPNTKAYWRKVRKQHFRDANARAALRKF